MFALYADLMLIAGLAAFPLYALTRSERLERQPLAAIWRAERWLCAAGLLVSTLGMGVLAASMQGVRSEEHTSELQSLMRISYAVFCLKKKKIMLNHMRA